MAMPVLLNQSNSVLPGTHLEMSRDILIATTGVGEVGRWWRQEYWVSGSRPRATAKHRAMQHSAPQQKFTKPKMPIVLKLTSPGPRLISRLGKEIERSTILPGTRRAMRTLIGIVPPHVNKNFPG